MYSEASDMLSGVGRLVEVALFAASTCCTNQQSCSETARLGFGALTGGVDLTKVVDPTRCTA